MCHLDMYLISVISSEYFIITDIATNAPSHGNNVFDEINTNDKQDLKRKMELFCILSSKETSKIGMIHSVTKNISIDFSK